MIRGGVELLFKSNKNLTTKELYAALAIPSLARLSKLLVSFTDFLRNS
jgi:hypothetical protein